MSPKQPVTDDEIREILRRGRFEDLSVLTAIGAMVGVCVVVLVIQLGVQPTCGVFLFGCIHELGFG